MFRSEEENARVDWAAQKCLEEFPHCFLCGGGHDVEDVDNCKRNLGPKGKRQKVGKKNNTNLSFYRQKPLDFWLSLVDVGKSSILKTSCPGAPQEIRWHKELCPCCGEKAHLVDHQNKIEIFIKSIGECSKATKEEKRRSSWDWLFRLNWMFHKMLKNRLQKGKKTKTRCTNLKMLEIIVGLYSYEYQEKKLLQKEDCSSIQMQCQFCRTYSNLLSDHTETCLLHASKLLSPELVARKSFATKYVYEYLYPTSLQQ